MTNARPRQCAVRPPSTGRRLAVALVLGAAVFPLAGCSQAPFDRDATELLNAADHMELVQSFALRPRFGDLDFRRVNAPQVFYPSLGETDVPFGLFVEAQPGYSDMEFADAVRSTETGELESITPVSGRHNFRNTDPDNTGFYLRQRREPFADTAGEMLDGDLFFTYATGGSDVDLEILLVDSSEPGVASTGYFSELTEVFGDFTSILAFNNPDPRGIAVGSSSQTGTLPPVIALFDHAGTWRLVGQEIDSASPGDPFLNTNPVFLDTSLDAPAPDLPEPDPTQPDADDDITPGIVHLYLPTSEDYHSAYVFVSFPTEAGVVTYRQAPPENSADRLYEPIDIQSPIVAVLSSEALLVRAGSRYEVYDFEGRRQSRFSASSLRFVHEREIDGRWYSYFSGSYWGGLDGEDYVFFRIYRLPTDEL